MEALLDTPRGHHQHAVEIAGSSSSLPPTAVHTHPAQHASIASSAGAARAAGAKGGAGGAGEVGVRVSVAAKATWHEKQFRKALAAEEARKAAEVAFATRLIPHSKASAGRAGARSLTTEGLDISHEAILEERQKEERYGTFIERVRKERANAIMKASREAAEARERHAATAASVRRRAASADSARRRLEGDSTERDEDDETRHARRARRARRAPHVMAERTRRPPQPAWLRRGSTTAPADSHRAMRTRAVYAGAAPVRHGQQGCRAPGPGTQERHWPRDPPARRPSCGPWRINEER